MGESGPTRSLILLDRIAVMPVSATAKSLDLVETLESLGAIEGSVEPLLGQAAGWTIARLPEHRANARGHETIARILLSQGFRVSPVLALDGGATGLAAASIDGGVADTFANPTHVGVLDAVITVRMRPNLPTSWCELMLRQVLPMSATAHATGDPGVWAIGTGHAFGGDVLALVRALGERPETVWVEPRVLSGVQR